LPAGVASRPVATRPFWMHQGVEYLLGGVLLASGLQSPTPAVPAVLGVVMATNAAVTRGPLSAFRWIGPGLHRRIDLIVLTALVIGALQPFVSVDVGTRVLVLGVAAVFAVVWSQSNFVEKAKRQPAEGDRSSELGRRAGRAVGGTINSAKRMTQRDQTSDE
jgi:hypothetical protein